MRNFLKISNHAIIPANEIGTNYVNFKRDRTTRQKGREILNKN